MVWAHSSMRMERCTQASTEKALAMVLALFGLQMAPSIRVHTSTIACTLFELPQLAVSVLHLPVSQFSVRHGWGTFKFSNGNVYTGEFFSGMQHGRGTLVYADGRREDGEFRNDKFLLPGQMCEES